MGGSVVRRNRSRVTAHDVGNASGARYRASMSILLMLVVLLALLGVLGAGIAGIVVFVSRNSKKSAGGGVQGVVGGWYPDPEDPVMDRYHDGQTWTAHTRPHTAVGD